MQEDKDEKYRSGACQGPCLNGLRDPFCYGDPVCQTGNDGKRNKDDKYPPLKVSLGVAAVKITLRRQCQHDFFIICKAGLGVLKNYGKILSVKLWPFLGLMAVVLAAFMARIPLVASERLWPDEALYAYCSRLIAANPFHIFDPQVWRDHLPVFAAILRLGDLLHEGIIGSHLLMVLINLSGIVLAYRLGRALGGVFTGLMGAIFLSTNVWYFLHAGMVLIDPLLTVACLLLAAALSRVSLGPDARGRNSRYVAGLAALFAAACKWYAVLLVGPILLFYFLAAFPHERLKDRCKAAGAALAIAVVPLLPFLIFKVILMREHGGPVSYFPQPPQYYVLSLSLILGGPWFVALLLWAPFFLLRYPARVKALLYTMILVPFVVMSSVVEKDVRYILPAIPFLMIFLAIAVKGLLGLLVKGLFRRRIGQAVALAAAFLLFIPFFNGAVRERWQNDGYTGFYAAGHRIKEIAGDSSVVFAGSPMAMRYATDIDTAKRVLPLPQSKEAFVEALRAIPGRVLVETDVWEFTQP